MAKRKKEWNFIESDAKDMTPLQKGEILYHHRMGKKPKEISGITGFSMDWIKILVGALMSWRHMDDLINLYIAKQEKEHGEKEITAELPSSLRRISDKTSDNKRTKRSVSGRKNARHNTGRRHFKSRTSIGNNKGGKIVKKLRKSKDYVGD